MFSEKQKLVEQKRKGTPGYGSYSSENVLLEELNYYENKRKKKQLAIVSGVVVILVLVSMGLILGITLPWLNEPAPASTPVPNNSDIIIPGISTSTTKIKVESSPIPVTLASTEKPSTTTQNIITLASATFPTSTRGLPAVNATLTTTTTNSPVITISATSAPVGPGNSNIPNNNNTGNVDQNITPSVISPSTIATITTTSTSTSPAPVILNTNSSSTGTTTTQNPQLNSTNGVVNQNPQQIIVPQPVAQSNNTAT